MKIDDFERQLASCLFFVLYYDIMLISVKRIGISKSFVYLCIVKHLKHHKLYAKVNQDKAIS